METASLEGFGARGAPGAGGETPQAGGPAGRAREEAPRPRGGDGRAIAPSSEGRGEAGWRARLRSGPGADPSIRRIIGRPDETKPPGGKDPPGRLRSSRYSIRRPAPSGRGLRT